MLSDNGRQFLTQNRQRLSTPGESLQTAPTKITRPKTIALPHGPSPRPVAHRWSVVPVTEPTAAVRPGGSSRGGRGDLTPLVAERPQAIHGRLRCGVYLTGEGNQLGHALDVALGDPAGVGTDHEGGVVGVLDRRSSPATGPGGAGWPSLEGPSVDGLDVKASLTLLSPSRPGWGLGLVIGSCRAG